MASTDREAKKEPLRSIVADSMLALPQKAELSMLPTEVQIHIIKHVIPGTVEPQIYTATLDHIGITETVQMGTAGIIDLNTFGDTLQLDGRRDVSEPTGIPAGSLSIARTSKHFYDIAMVVLYSNRCFGVEMSLDTRGNGEVKKPLSMLGIELTQLSFGQLPTHPRWDYLKNMKGAGFAITNPLDCLELLTLHTPASDYMAHLLLHVDRDTINEGPEPQFLHIIKSLRKIHILEL